MELQLKEISKDIVKKPYGSIIQWAEQRLKLVGSKTFPVIALMPISLISPDMPYQDRKIRSNINTLVLSPSGSAKSSLTEAFGEITYSPLSFNDITKAKFIEKIAGRTDISFYCGDIYTVFRDPKLMKILEGILGEEKKLSSENMRMEINQDINAVFLGAGLPSSLTTYASMGMLRRLTPIVMFHSKEEKDNINLHVTRGMFDTSPKIVHSIQIKDFYQKIYNIQKGNDNEFEPVEGYIVDEKFKDGIYERHKELSSPFKNEQYLVTELQSGFRYMCNHAMLNLFNRKIENKGFERRIAIEEDDFEIAKNLMEMEMRMKFFIYTCNRAVKTSTNVLQLYNSILNNTEMDITYKNIAKVFLEDAIGKKIKASNEGER